MNLVLPSRMTVDEFLAWSERQEKGRYELFDGKVIMQQSEKWGHSRTKANIFMAFHNAIKNSGLAFFTAMDGPTVRITEGTAFEPDALVAPLPEPHRDSLEIPNPIIVVEVLSPSTATAQADSTRKLKGYFALQSVQHYLIVDPDECTVTHHKRGAGDLIETRIVNGGMLLLAPPGIEISVADVFA